MMQFIMDSQNFIINNSVVMVMNALLTAEKVNERVGIRSDEEME